MASSKNSYIIYANLLLNWSLERAKESQTFRFAYEK